MKIQFFEPHHSPEIVPDCYCWIEHCQSGEHWLVPIRGNALLDLRHILKKWAKQVFCGELAIDGELIPRLQGDYYASIITDGRPVNSVVVWKSGGFYLKNTQN